MRSTLHRLRWWLAAGLLVLVGAIWLFVLVVTPPDEGVPSGDAVVVHAGGTGDRLREGVHLIERHSAAPVLVAMYGADVESWPDGRPLCGQMEPFEVLCPAPRPVSTIGEARALGRIADERGWDDIVVVTSDYHLRRAVTLDDRCTDATVRGAASPSSLGIVSMAQRVIHEMVGMIQALSFVCD